jgi:hypothetical protein
MKMKKKYKIFSSVFLLTLILLSNFASKIVFGQELKATCGVVKAEEEIGRAHV